VLQNGIERVPLVRLERGRVVTLVLYLASDDSSYVSGSEMVIDGRGAGAMIKVVCCCAARELEPRALSPLVIDETSPTRRGCPDLRKVPRVPGSPARPSHEGASPGTELAEPAGVD